MVGLKRLRSNRGFTLLETVCALLVFTLSVITVATMIATAGRANLESARANELISRASELSEDGGVISESRYLPLSFSYTGADGGARAIAIEKINLSLYYDSDVATLGKLYRFSYDGEEAYDD